jgi:hypothetical protein
MLNTFQSSLVMDALKATCRDDKHISGVLHHYEVWTPRKLSREQGLHCLAHCEAKGYRQPGKPEDYWRSRFLSSLPDGPAKDAHRDALAGDGVRVGSGYSPLLDLADKTLFPRAAIAEMGDELTRRVESAKRGTGDSPVSESASSAKSADDFCDYEDPHQDSSTYTEEGAAAWRASLGLTLQTPRSAA